MLEDIIILTVIVILPIIPAFILYKFLPAKGRTYAKGPFKGLNIQLTGAFAGYFVVLLFVGGFFFLSPIKEANYELWTVSGRLQLEQGGFDSQDMLISVTPPEQRPYPDGRFIIKKVLMPKHEEVEKPSLIIHKAGYEIATVILEEKSPNMEGLRNYQIKYSKEQKNINIGEPIILRKKGERFEYSKESREDVTPIEGDNQ